MLHWFLLLFGCLIHVLFSSFLYHFFCNIFKYSLNTRADTLILEINLDFKTISMELQYLSYRSFNECVFEKTRINVFVFNLPTPTLKSKAEHWMASSRARSRSTQSKTCVKYRGIIIFISRNTDLKILHQKMSKLGVFCRRYL